MTRAKGKRLRRLRSERVERSFAHVCDTGGSRRTWIRRLEEVTKRYLIAAAAHNLGADHAASCSGSASRGRCKPPPTLFGLRNLIPAALWAVAPLKRQPHKRGSNYLCAHRSHAQSA